MLSTLLIAILCLVMPPADEPAPPAVVVVVGAPGTPEFAAQFEEWSQHWRAAAEKAKADFTLIGAAPAGEKSDFDQLREAVARLAGESASPLWLVLIGHGTFDGQAAKFNLRGPDVTPNHLSEWLAPLKRPVAVINCASASAPFVNKLAGADRVIITATRSGNEQNFARFGQYVSAAIADPGADLDKDNQVSLLEAYLTACRQVKEFYDQEARLATEHALLDDNGDGLGTPPTWFRGLRATQRAKDGASLDGTRAHQWHLVKSDRELRMPAEARERRDKLELQIADLRAKKGQLSEDDYYKQLEPLLVEVARIYEAFASSESNSPPTGGDRAASK
jgi:hypothetical protein